MTLRKAHDTGLGKRKCRGSGDPGGSNIPAHGVMGCYRDPGPPSAHTLLWPAGEPGLLAPGEDEQGSCSSPSGQWHTEQRRKRNEPRCPHIRTGLRPPPLSGHERGNQVAVTSEVWALAQDSSRPETHRDQSTCRRSCPGPSAKPRGEGAGPSPTAALPIVSPWQEWSDLPAPYPARSS